MDTYISRYISISNEGIALNRNVLYTPQGIRGLDMLVDAYKALGLNYPKFYKMDNLCKLAVLSGELLLRDHTLTDKYKPADIAIILSTAHSSLDTDKRYWDTVPEAPSPSLFVYTLPNVMLGELCIRWGIKGENTCFVSENFETESQTNYVNYLLGNDYAEVCLCGWADYLDGEMKAFFMLVEKNPSSLGYNPDTVKKLYDSAWKN